MVLPPPGHPMDNAAHHTPLDSDGGSGPRSETADLQGSLDELMSLLRNLVAAGSPPEWALHSAKVGAPRRAQPPQCPHRHPGCVTAHVGEPWGKAAARTRFMSWKFPAWTFLPHQVLRSNDDHSRGGGGHVVARLSFYVDAEGTIYDGAVHRVGDVRAGIDPRIVPCRDSQQPQQPGGDPAGLIDSEVARLTRLLAGVPDPDGPSDDTYVTAVLLPWLYESMARRDNPGLAKVPGTGLVAKKGWSLIQPMGWLLQDGTIKDLRTAPTRPVGPDDEANLRCLADLAHLGPPPLRDAPLP